MKTTEVNKELIGRRCECIFTGLMVTGVIEDTEENEHTIEVKVRFDHPHQWGDDLYNDVWAWGRKIDEFGTLHHLQLLIDKPDFQIMTVVFGESISRIDRSVFEDVDMWGVCSLQGWVNSYESVRFVAINDHSIYNKKEITTDYDIVNANQINENNPQNSYILLKKIDEQKRVVMDSGTFHKKQLSNLLYLYRIKSDAIETVIEKILDLALEINEWIRISGNYFMINDRLLSETK